VAKLRDSDAFWKHYEKIGFIEMNYPATVKRHLPVDKSSLNTYSLFASLSFFGTSRDFLERIMSSTRKLLTCAIIKYSIQSGIKLSYVNSRLGEIGAGISISNSSQLPARHDQS
jgi:hypothetical protein